MTGDAFIQDAVQQGGAAAEAVYMTNLDYPNTSQLRASYQRTFGSAPVDLPIVACGYDGMQRIVEAIKVAQKGAPIQQVLLQVLGAERTANRREAIFQIEKGQLKRVDWRRPPTP